MGLEIKRNKKGEYNATSTISGMCIHENKWISENELKKILIERQFNNFLEKAIKIDMDFPNGYQVNDNYISDEGKGHQFNRWYVDALSENNYDLIDQKFEEIKERLNLEL